MWGCRSYLDLLKAGVAVRQNLQLIVVRLISYVHLGSAPLHFYRFVIHNLVLMRSCIVGIIYIFVRICMGRSGSLPLRGVVERSPVHYCILLTVVMHVV